MDSQGKFDKLVEQYPHPTKSFYARPHLSRRHFFQLAGAGVTASFLANRLKAAPVISTSGPVTPKNTARNVVFILLAGAPSHTDTFDFKMIDGVTPESFNPATVNNVTWPTGIMPKLGAQLGDIAIIRSMRAWALVHGLGQNWVQIGRNPAAVLGNISPNIGSVVAIEKERERRPGQVFPTFLALNSSNGAGPGYFNSEYAPFRVQPSVSGITNTINSTGQQRFGDRYDYLHHIDDALRQNSPYGKPVEDYDHFYQAAQGMMYNPTVSKAFQYSAAESSRYGNTGFGNALLVAKQVLTANEGARFIQVTQGGWDMHQNIYAPAQLPTFAKLLDDGLSAFLADLKASGQLDSTMVVMLGEFGRTTGKLTSAGGRDHFLQQFVMFAGGGVKGGRAIGSTDATGSMTVDPGWSRQRDIKPEDIEATIYSAMGIDWTTVRHDDPLGRGFYYVPNSDQDVYGPVDELWGG
ncbi:MAG: DUF1501 domain-containing protein [Acidobacteriota bacterium]|nr:DUF1501 domain-containing protein [Acidobacteriota bacterium]